MSITLYMAYNTIICTISFGLLESFKITLLEYFILKIIKFKVTEKSIRFTPGYKHQGITVYYEPTRVVYYWNSVLKNIPHTKSFESFQVFILGGGMVKNIKIWTMNPIQIFFDRFLKSTFDLVRKIIFRLVINVFDEFMGHKFVKNP